MPRHGEVLVAILNNLLDLNVAREQGWYRIPVSSAEKWLKDSWPPQWLASYQTRVFREERYTLRSRASVQFIDGNSSLASRATLGGNSATIRFSLMA